ncbi:hypothetical protein JCM10207_005675 [Rhodosporidiobolus poonsookiae]
MSNPTASGPKANPPAAANAASASAAPAAATAAAPGTPGKPNQYSVAQIPPFNYAAAAAKAKPSPAAVSGQDVTGVLNHSTGAGSPTVSAAAAMAAAGQGSQPTSPVQSSQKKPSVQVDGVRVPPSRVDAIRGAPDVAFGTANDKNAQLSSSPAAPPAFNQANANPKTFGSIAAEAASAGTPAAAPATKAPINLHSFFTSGGSSAPAAPSPAPSTSPAPVPMGMERRSLATYDPQASRSPQPSTSPLPHVAPPSHLGAPNGQPFVPRNMAPPFIPGQQPGAQAFSPPAPSFYGNGPQPGAPAFIPIKGPSPQNIPNGAPYPGAPSSAGSRPGSFVGSPNLGGSVPRPLPQGGRPSFGGPTSPRMGQAPLGQGQPMMYPQQGYNVRSFAPLPAIVDLPVPSSLQPYAPYNPYAAQGGFYPPAFVPGGPPPMPSGNSTPSTGVHTPKPALPGSPSIANSHVPTASPSTASFPSYASPQTQNASLPRPNAAAPLFTPAAPTTPMRVGVPEFRPTGSPFSLAAAAESPVFTPRKSAAIKIVNPKEKAAQEAKAKEEKEKADKEAKAAEPAVEEKKVEEEKAAPAPAAAEEPKKEDVEAATRKAEEAAAAKKQEEEQAKTEAETAQLNEQAAAAKAKAAESTEKKGEEAAQADKPSSKPAAVDDLKRAETASVDTSAPSTPGEEVAGLNVRSSEAEAVRAEEAALLADEKVSVEQKAPADALVEAREALNATGSIPGPAASVPPTPTTASHPSFLPAKPASSPVPDATAANAQASTSQHPSSAAIAAARPISDLSAVSYPEAIKAPQADLNLSAEPGKYRYDRDFLLQFMAVCRAKPDSLPNLADIGMVDDGSLARGPSGSGFPRRGGNMGPPSVPSRSGSMQFGRTPSTGGFGGMGNFGQGSGAGMTSEQRFAASLSRSQSGAFGGARGSMSRTTSQTGMGGAFGGNNRPKSERGKRRGDKKEGERDESRKPGQHVAGEGFENATLEPRSASGWAPSVLLGSAASKDVDMSSPEMVQRKVKALLNKLTLERFDSISNQILEWANKSVDETDGRILRQVIALIFEKATDEATWSEMYARLCRKLMETVSSEVRDENVKAADGTPVAGGALFRKYLLNRCQEDYEKGWQNKEAAAAAAKSKEADDKAKQEANDAAKKEAEESGKEPSKEAELLSDEYYAAQKAKRRGLGLVRFIGELYRLSMLTERIMHECIKKLLANTDSPEEEDVESLCRLLTTVGKGLDNVKAKQHMDVYFSRMKTIADSPKTNSRMRFMIMDVFDLRANRWESKTAAAGPKTISEIHADAQKQAEESARRVASSGGKLPRLGDQLSRPNSRRGQGRGDFVAQVGADGWTTQPQRPAKAGDLSAFGRIRDTSAGISLGPTGAFANRNRKPQKEEAPRPATPSNPFALLSGDGSGDAEPAAPAPERPRLKLQPRTKPIGGEEEEEKDEEKKDDEEDEDDGAIDPNASSMSRSEAERRAKNSVDEFFSVKNVSEGVASVEALPKEFRGILVSALSEAALTKKADAVNLTKELFGQVVEKGIVAHDAMLAAFEPVFKTLVDTAMDAPSAYQYASILANGSGLSRDEIETLAQKMESEDGEEEAEYGREQFWKSYDKVIQPAA